MGGEFFQCIKQRSFDHQKAGGVKERFAAVMKSKPSPPPPGGRTCCQKAGTLPF